MFAVIELLAAAPAVVADSIAAIVRPGTITEQQVIAAPLITITTTAKCRAIVDIPASFAALDRTSAAKSQLTIATRTVTIGASITTTDTTDLGTEG